MSGYDNWSLDGVQDECQARQIEFSSKDGVKTLSSKLRTNDKLSDVVDKSGEVQKEKVKNIEMGTDREVLEQSKLPSKTISAQSDFNISHDYGMKGEIPQDPMSFESMQSHEQRGSLTFEERMTLLRFEREMALAREEFEVRGEERRQQARMEDKAFYLELERE
jgi:hypothetical protein